MGGMTLADKWTYGTKTTTVKVNGKTFQWEVYGWSHKSGRKFTPNGEPLKTDKVDNIDTEETIHFDTPMFPPVVTYAAWFMLGLVVVGAVISAGN